ncbi:MAG: leucyl/phenylalanyl-tRNA--protein transferase [Bacteroidia bacterium]|nr:leucyl/phenylalanyl-tRNA--protein transferase [Bacteroidia bacterium]NND25265.1 leucyl/phenylalanyl-tRNA--protein transferase [Flavobacteriaceae bacterium]NNK61090.1 leucyl/phenylalanyl-tRNA--protein transferase [Flavobacteriaceae bacterium]
MQLLDANDQFPDVSKANADGLLAMGGDLSVSRLIEAYKKGIFPWFDNEGPILWWSPDPRFVLFPNKLKVSKSMHQIIRNGRFTVTENKKFHDVITACSEVERDGQASSWITSTMVQAYCKLHEQGLAKSVEVWLEDMLVGGLYGIDLGNGVFCGESMFSKVSNASKLGFITFVNKSSYTLIDCQVYTKHLASLGAEEMSRDEFLLYLT